MSIDELTQQIRLATEALTAPTIRQVAEWIQTHLVEIAWKTIDDVAQETSVSPASVIRCSQQLGFSGYSHLQRTIRDALPTSGSLVEKLADPPEAVNVSPSALVLTQERENFDRFDQTLMDHVDHLATMLVHTSRVGVIASLTSVALGQYLASHLNFLLGNVSFFEAESSASWIFLRDATPTDLMIALTFPRYSKAVHRMTKQFHEKNVQTVLITDIAGKTLLPVTLALGLPISGDLFSAGPPVTVIVQMLAHALKHLNPDGVTHTLKTTDQLLAKAGVLLRNTGYHIR